MIRASLLAMLIASAAGATSPLDYGAIADDGLDDGPAFRSALSVACAVGGDRLIYVPPGVYDLGQQPATLASVTVSGCDGLTIRGSGRTSVLRQPPRQMTDGENFFMLYVLSSDFVTVRDLKMDGRQSDFSCLSGNCEQIHLINVNASDYFQVADVLFVESYGDGIKVSAPAQYTNIHDCVFLAQRRMGITISGSSAYDTMITRNLFIDENLHVESGAPTDRTIIARNRFSGSSELSFGVNGYSNGVVIADNDIEDGRILVTFMSDVVIVGNTVSSTTGVPVFVRKMPEGLVLFGNRITNTEPTSLGCINIETTAAGDPTADVALSGNHCEHGAASGFHLHGSLHRVAVTGNVFVNLRATDGQGVYMFTPYTSASTVGVVAFGGNVFHQEHIGVSIEVQNTDVDDVAVVGNVMTSAIAASLGVQNTVWNHGGYTGDYIPHCRVDANIIDVVSLRVKNVPISTGPAPGAGEGCLTHGDVVPP